MLVCRIRYLATGSTDACIALWDVEDMVCVRTFVSMDNEVNNLSFTPDGRHISYFDKLAGLSILDVETGGVPPRSAALCTPEACCPWCLLICDPPATLAKID